MRTAGAHARSASVLERDMRTVALRVLLTCALSPHVYAGNAKARGPFDMSKKRCEETGGAPSCERMMTWRGPPA